MDVTLENLDEWLVGGAVTPIHPGRLFNSMIVKRRSLQIDETAKKMKLSPEALSNILEEKSPVTADIAQEMADIAGNTQAFWLRSQKIFDLWSERERRQKIGMSPGMP